MHNSHQCGLLYYIEIHRLSFVFSKNIHAPYQEVESGGCNQQCSKKVDIKIVPNPNQVCNQAKLVLSLECMKHRVVRQMNWNADPYFPVQFFRTQYFDENIADLLEA